MAEGEKKKMQFLEEFASHACPVMVSAAAMAARAKRYQDKPAGDLVKSLAFRTLERDLDNVRRMLLKRAAEFRAFADAIDPESPAAGAAPAEKGGRS